MASSFRMKGARASDDVQDLIERYNLIKDSYNKLRLEIDEVNKQGKNKALNNKIDSL